MVVHYLGESTAGQDVLAQTLNRIALIYYYREDFTRAEQYYSQASKVAHQYGFHGQAATSLANLGNIASERDEPERASDYYEAALLEASASMDALRLATSYHASATFARDYGLYPQAQIHASSAIAMAVGISNLKQRVTTLAECAGVLRQSGQVSRAEVALRQTEQLLPQVNHPLRESTVLVELARLEHSKRNLLAYRDYAVQAHARSFVEDTASRDAHHMGNCLELVRACLSQDDVLAAEQIVAEMQEIVAVKATLAAGQQRSYQADLAIAEALVAQARHDYATADEQFGLAIRSLKRSQRLRRAELSVAHARLLHSWAEVEQNPTLHQRASTTLQQAIKLFERMELRAIASEYHTLLNGWQSN